MPVNPFKWKHYEGDIILLNVRWYLKYALSYRNSTSTAYSRSKGQPSRGRDCDLMKRSPSYQS